MDSYVAGDAVEVQRYEGEWWPGIVVSIPEELSHNPLVGYNRTGGYVFIVVCKERYDPAQGVETIAYPNHATCIRKVKS